VTIAGLTLSGVDSGNYVLVPPTTTTATITAAPLTVTANDAAKTYGDTVTFAGTEFTTNGLVNDDTVTGVTLTSAGADATAPVSGSPYDIVASNATGTGLDNYSISYLAIPD
jgi:large repetitive protein